MQSSTNFENDNWSWQLQQLGQQFQEWWEFYSRDLGRRVEPWLPSEWWKYLNVPDWLYNLLLWVTFTWLVVWLALRFLRWRSPYLLRGLVSQPQSARPASGKSLIRASQQYAAQGNYTEACRYLYLAMLELLHEKGQIPQQRSLTDGEYRTLLASLPGSDRYYYLIDVHEQLCFAEQTMSVDVFEQCRVILINLEKTAKPKPN